LLSVDHRLPVSHNRSVPSILDELHYFFPERGRQLCAYVNEYLDLGMPCTKEFWELILAVACVFENNLPEIDPMATSEKHHGPREN
jgi:hypothetical protein